MDSFFGNNTALYFYSAVFQGNMALIALAGIFATFVLQQNLQKLNSNGEKLISFVLERTKHNHFAGQWLHSWFVDPQRLLDRIDYIQNGGMKVSENNKVESINLIKSFNNDAAYLRIRTQHINLKNNNARIVDALKKPFYWTISVIILSLVLLALANYIHKLWDLYEWIPICLIIVLNVIALFENKKYIFSIFQYTERVIQPIQEE
ncbi:MAG: hypothetical protein C0417_04760 [Chlorobiaceae bacterium]|nr:hypothetical protein [Chlorobiaceae bacterium]